mmetsp:Transcript_30501/g.73155  ORF Transcript_30501/g.73155 Transcript_30501/m.73155 type:complete len:391 (-) Transcript_30501:149-1321(-)|eukprot:CAMPEP_0113632494 /NCGR_PEP_ID=MMETSP0017_2-20120614/16892_1 /TAXON_ID=2856 /ORGANISM="Cylindrotheca closterium" /LENGTH=390 /DNA_ID=CAMNT_0000543057 /DNA_START=544 /DNA_END=1716 /DNA_ORIENTATION=- /assembly_acc=CAM_ASM_000147
MGLDPSIITASVVLDLERYDNLIEDQENIVRHPATDIQRISHLGKGAFCNVSLVISHSSKKQLAMKLLDEEKIESTEQFHRAATDLMMEAHYLSKLDHPNIIKIRGVSSTPFSSSYGSDGDGYFITMDVMQETLRDRIPKWYDDKSSFDNNRKGLKNRLTGKRKTLNLESMYGRIETVAVGIAEAINYMHEKGIIIRDLKPANVGFHAETGKVCLLDFGFARELSLCTEGEICGTPRYMSPEVLRGEGYSFKSDVYSFGMMLHEIISLEHSWRPKKRSISSHAELLTACDTLPKPTTENIPCRNTALLIEDCISDDPETRPTFDVICMTLDQILPSTVTKDRRGDFSALKSQLDACGAGGNYSFSSLPDLDDEVDALFDGIEVFNSSAEF